MASASTSNPSSSSMARNAMPPTSQAQSNPSILLDPSRVPQTSKSISLCPVPATNAGGSNNGRRGSNGVRESFQTRMNAQINGFSTERERSVLMRTITHLRKEDNSVDSDTSNQRACQTEDGEGEQLSSRPFHHSEVASPPLYTPAKSVRTRMSLDIRRPRGLSINDTSPYLSISLRKRFTRSQFDLSSTNVVDSSIECGPSTSSFTPSQDGTSTNNLSIEEGVNQGKVHTSAMGVAASKLQKLSFTAIPKLTTLKQTAAKKKASQKMAVDKGKQKEMSSTLQDEEGLTNGVDPIIIRTHDAADGSGVILVNNDRLTTVDPISAFLLDQSSIVGILESQEQVEDATILSPSTPSTLTEGASSSEDGDSNLHGSIRSSNNSSRRNSHFPRPNVRQSSLANVTTSNESDSNDDGDDDGIRWATPSASLHPFTNPFDKLNLPQNRYGDMETESNTNATAPNPLTTNTSPSSLESPPSPKRKSSLLFQTNQKVNVTTESENQNASSHLFVSKMQDNSWKAKMAITNIRIPFALSSFTSGPKGNGKVGSAMGVDEENAYLDRISPEGQAESEVNSGSEGSTGSDSQETNSSPQHQQSGQYQEPMYTNQSSTTQSSSNNVPPRRTRSSHLAHLPRLNSSRGKQGLGGSGSNGTGGGGGMGGASSGGGGRGGDEGDDRRDSSASQFSEDPPSDDDTVEGQEEGESDSEGSLMISDEDDSDLSGMPGSMPQPFATGLHAHRMSRASSSTSRNNLPGGISLPPAPTFDHMEPFMATQKSHLESNGKTHAEVGPTETISAQGDIIDVTTPRINNEAESAFQGTSSVATKTFNPSFTPIANRESWTQFGEDTPGWLPTPRASGPGLKVITKTPVGTINEEQSQQNDTSYFNICPAPAQNVIRSNRNDQRDSTNSHIPPPSPSIITRARAQSSASLRSMGLMTPTTSSRELPPMPPIVPLNLRSSQRSRSPHHKIISPSPVVARTSLLDTTDEANLDSSIEEEQDEILDSRRTTPRPATSSAAIDRAATASPQHGVSSVPRSLGKRSGGAMVNIPESPSRPNLYKQESRSLIDLNSSVRRQIEPTLMPLRTPLIGKGDGEAAAQSHLEHKKSHTQLHSQQFRVASPAPSTASAGSVAAATAPPSGLRRRRSMYEVGAAPPPYTTIAGVRYEDAQAILPREEEGSESLPNYHCSVHIEGYLPRKMEFSSPGVQAKDRSWKRQYFVLHGTCLRIYRTDMSGDRSAAKGEFGVMSGVHVHAEPMNEDGPTLPSQSGTGSRLIPTDGNTQNNTKDQHVPTPSSAASIETSPTNSTNGNQFQSINSRTSQSFNRSSSASIHSNKGSESHHSSSNGGLHRKVEAISGTISHSLHRGGLVKQYTLQGAESGLAADYLKRRHVVRVRAEGEQFLLQTRNDRHVVDWIEAFQAATNIAMDLERRPMPKFITLPRRRRRRNNQRSNRDTVNGGDSNQTPQNGAEGVDGVIIGEDDGLSARELADIAEARRRSLMESTASSSQRSSISGAGTQASSRTPNPPRPLGLPGDESPNPSAAFERMLRDEEDAMARQDAGFV